MNTQTYEFLPQDVKDELTESGVVVSIDESLPTGVVRIVEHISAEEFVRRRRLKRKQHRQNVKRGRR